MEIPEVYVYIVVGLYLVSMLFTAIVIGMLHKRLKRHKSAYDALVKLADVDNWGEVTFVSSRNGSPETYKTWVGRDNPQSMARKAL